jgi:hypothetical protein
MERRIGVIANNSEPEKFHPAVELIFYPTTATSYWEGWAFRCAKKALTSYL